MIHWPTLSRQTALAALESRKAAVSREIQRIERVRLERQPQPDFIEAIFDFTTGQLAAEKSWIAATLKYMRAKPGME